MNRGDAYYKAHAWLVAHGYAQFKDGVWSYEGQEVDAESVLIEYIEENE